MYSNFIKGIIVLWNKTIINVIMLYIMTFHYINKIHFNRGQGRLPCILLLLGNEGTLCDSIKIVIGSGKIDNASLF